MWLLHIIIAIFLNVEALSSLESESFSMNINMPDIRPSMHDDYICTAKKLNPVESYIVQYEPDADGKIAHHMLLFGCQSLHNQNHLYPGHWNCGGDLCSRMTIMYGWAKNAPSMKLPPNVGFLVGGNSSIQYLILQIHYAKPLPVGSTDNSGLKLHITTQRQKYVMGIHLLSSDSAQILPRQLKFHVDINCKFQNSIPIHAFAYRVHTHKLGIVVSGYKFNTMNGSWTFLAKGNPQWPQAFYPMDQVQTVTNDDILAARCTYNSLRMKHPVQIGSTSDDEMCNLYLAYYTENRKDLLSPFSSCIGIEFYNLIPNLPFGSDVPLPANPVLEQQAASGHKAIHNPVTYSNVENTKETSLGEVVHPSVSIQEHKDGINLDNNLKPAQAVNYAFSSDKLNSEFSYNAVYGWPSKDLKFGQIAAVTLNSNGNVVIFHRGDHVWNERTFDVANRYLLAEEGPISVPTVVVLDSVTGMVVHQWGTNRFYMPHGLFLCHDGSYWLTDVALHQVFHFSESGDEPILVLGEKFVPGRDREHFCKPASVAISAAGDIYVADGYCNSRIVRFSSDGKFLNQWGKQHDMFDDYPPAGTFRIPHKVILLEDRNLVCVADRENGRIQCFTMVSGIFRFLIQHKEFAGTLYSISYSQEKGLLYGINGEAFYKNYPVKAFVFNITDQKLLNTFAPKTGTFTRPHDIAVSQDSEEAYVCEIGPNIVWKFIREYHKSTKKVLLVSESGNNVNSASATSGNYVQGAVISKIQHSDKEHQSTDLSDEAGSFETSMVIMAFLSIPVLLVILITVVMRLKKRGKLQSCSFGHLKGWIGGYRTPHPQEKFNLGTLLNPHKGFDRVSMEESDGEENDSDSEVEEFSAINKKSLA